MKKINLPKNKTNYNFVPIGNNMIYLSIKK